MSAIDDATVAAQLAFIRAERTVQRSRAGRRLFMQRNGAATERRHQLTALCDSLTETLLSALRQLPAYPDASIAQRDAAERATEWVARYGAGLPLETPSTEFLQALSSPLLEVLVTRGGDHRAWPRSVHLRYGTPTSRLAARTRR